MVRRRFIVLGILSFVALCGAQVGKYVFSQIVCNDGVGFGIGGGVWPLVFEGCFIGGVWFFLFRELRAEISSRFIFLVLIGGGFLLGGALSNLLDRFIFGCVSDYFQPFLWFPAFNIADIGVSMGAGLLVIHFFCRDFVLK